MDGWLDGWMMKGRKKFNSEHKYVCEYNQHTFCSGDKDQIERREEKKENFLHISPFACAIHSTKKDENKI